MDNAWPWLHSHTFHHSRFSDIRSLLQQKEEQNLCISLCLPTLNEEETVASLVRNLRRRFLEEIPLLDEIAVIDSDSSDRTRELAAAAGADVYRSADILPEMGSYRGKGENLWKAVYQLRGDIILYLDADISNLHEGFVTGLLGPLLQDQQISFVKAFYDRPAGKHGDWNDGGRVTEILIRPLFALCYPDLNFFIQPLSGEYAVRRNLLEELVFPVGYGVETAHLIDISKKKGLDVMAQVDLDCRAHRQRGNQDLGRMSYAILQVLTRRWMADQRYMEQQLQWRLSTLIQFQRHNGYYRRHEHQIIEEERPAMVEVPAYRKKWALDGQVVNPPDAV